MNNRLLLQQAVDLYYEGVFLLSLLWTIFRKPMNSTTIPSSTRAVVT
jgi:hypothetical protein